MIPWLDAVLLDSVHWYIHVNLNKSSKNNCTNYFGIGIVLIVPDDIKYIYKIPVQLFILYGLKTFFISESITIISDLFYQGVV